MKMVALIPARAGSKRIPGKNTRLLAGHPLIAYTIAAAQQSGVFSEIAVWTDSHDVEHAAWPYAHVKLSLHVREPVSDDQPDIDWVRTALSAYDHRLQPIQAFAILRPTSPFRTAATIQRAFAQFRAAEVHSLRAVQRVTEHPGKMWQQLYPGYPIRPLIDGPWPFPDSVPLGGGVTPWHSRPTQTLPQVFVQNASLEMAWAYVVPAFGTISGRKVMPFFTEGYEGFDLNTEADWTRAEQLIASSAVTLPEILTHAHD